MKTQIAEQPASTTIGPEEVREALDRILSSKYFVNAHKKKEFLRLICDFHLKGRASELNEYILGYEVFARDNAYNPSGDPIVRVFAHEIRKKLENYYKTEGANDPIRLAIPAGTYQPVFTRQESKAAAIEREAPTASETLADTPLKAEVEPGWRRMSPGIVWMSFAVLCLAIAVVSLVMSNRQLRQRVSDAEAGQDTATNGEVWAPFLRDNSPPLVILSNPPVLRFTNPSDPEPVIKESIPLARETVKALENKFVMNPEVSIKDSVGPAGDSPAPVRDKVTIERHRTPSLILSTNVYTGMGEAIGLHYLTDFFRKAGRSILLKQSRTLSAEDLRKHNVILLGGVWVNEWSSKLTRSEDFVFTSKATIENRNPQAGEEREYIPQFDRRTGSLVVDYAVITVKPNIADANQVMLLAGIYSQGTEAAAEYVTNKNYHDQLTQRLQQSREAADRSPRYFQALLKVGVENGIPTTISILALHELPLSEL
ncbi:MAG TPA: hypothetical protein VGV87_21810 [Blastocatellia bacterium]|jgi:hypothetical protein|nr:hypothetical protein [Blastocatellia bacterium]